jgi:hypothetical protein
LYVVNSSAGAGYFNPVVNLAAGVDNIEVHCNQPDTASIAAITTLTSRPVTTDWLEDFNGAITTSKKRPVSAGGNNSGSASPNIFTLANDKAGYFQWDDVTRGLCLLAGNIGTAQAAIVFFRTGASASISSLAAGANVNVTTGALTGTTGTVGRLTISADTATNRIYVENRLGALYVWAPSFFNCSTGFPGVGIVSEFVALP